MKEHKSLVHVLEDVVLALEAEGQTEQDIFSLVNMCMRGFIRNGEITEEYKQLAQMAMMERQRAMTSRTIDTPPFVGLDGKPI
jgi:anaerobic ribonucleoside-triphosphate reductase